MGFANTIELERSLLKTFLTNQMLSRTFIDMVREEYFTNPMRKMIYALARQTLNTSQSLLSKRVFYYEIKSRLSDNEATAFYAEWNLVDAEDAAADPEEVIRRLSLAATGRKVTSLAQAALEKLQSGDIAEAVAELKRKSMLLDTGAGNDKPVVALTNIKARDELIENKKRHPEQYQGLKTGFATFDKYTGGLFPGELTLIAGVTGLGKSTFCKSLAKNIVTFNPGKNVLHVANEEYQEQVEYKYDALFTGIPYKAFKRAEIDDAGRDRWRNIMEKQLCLPQLGQIYIKEVPAFTDVSLVEQAYRELEGQGIHIDCIIIDHLPHVKPIQQSWGENDERAKAAADCKEIARMLKVPVILPTQASTEMEDKQMKGKRGSKMDVYGSKAQVHVANTFIIITYNGTDESQVGLPEGDRNVKWLIDCKKNRDGAPFCFNAMHYVQNGQVVETASDDDDDGGQQGGGAQYQQSSRRSMIDGMINEFNSVGESNEDGGGRPARMTSFIEDAKQAAHEERRQTITPENIDDLVPF